jgi:hypothetical protein
VCGRGQATVVLWAFVHAERVLLWGMCQCGFEVSFVHALWRTPLSPRGSCGCMDRLRCAVARLLSVPASR